MSRPATRTRWLLVALALVFVVYVAVRRIGLAPQDVCLVLAVGSYAAAEWWRTSRGSSGEENGLLGDNADADSVQLRMWDFFCEHHQLLGCVVRGKRHHRRGRSERFLSLAVATLAMLYWKALFRTRVRMSSLQALYSSLWTLVISKSVQQLIKRAIRFYAGRLRGQWASANWLDALQLQWQISQYWMLGFMMLCVILAIIEGAPARDRTRAPAILAHFRQSDSLLVMCAGRNWLSLLTTWLVNMAFALIFLDLALQYVKFKLLERYRRLRNRHRR